MIHVTLPDGDVKPVETGMTATEFAAQMSAQLEKKALAVKINGVPRDLSTPLQQDCSVEFLTFDSPDGAEIYRHSTSHLMAQGRSGIISGNQSGYWAGD